MFPTLVADRFPCCLIVPLRSHTVSLILVPKDPEGVLMAFDSCLSILLEGNRHQERQLRHWLDYVIGLIVCLHIWPLTSAVKCSRSHCRASSLPCAHQIHSPQELRFTHNNKRTWHNNWLLFPASRYMSAGLKSFPWMNQMTQLSDPEILKRIYDSANDLWHNMNGGWLVPWTPVQNC